MKNSIKILSIIMVMVMMLLAACSQENTSNSDSTSNNSSTGVVGKWVLTGGSIYQFTSDYNFYDEDGNKIGYYVGNDAEGDVHTNADNGVYHYSIAGNNMTWTSVADPTNKYYFTRQ